jgi:hypothetical protein
VRLTSYALQLGIVALGAGMDLVVVWQVRSLGVVLWIIVASVSLRLAMLAHVP